MKYTTKKVLGAIVGFAIGATVATSAFAASFSILDSSMNAVGPNAVLPASTGGTSGFDLSSIYGSAAPNVGDAITSFSGSPLNGGLYMDAASTLTFTFLGKEAGAKNASFGAMGSTLTNSMVIGSTTTALETGAGFIDFMFQTAEASWEDINGNGVFGETFGISNNSFSAFSGLKLAYGVVFNNGRSVLAFFGDGRGDSDFDDMVVRIDAVPVPAAGLMLLGAIGGLGALRSRRKKATA